MDKKIDYFGNILEVPEWVKWVAADACGDVYGYTAEPVQEFNTWAYDDYELNNDEEPVVLLGEIDTSIINWELTLKRVSDILLQDEVISPVDYTAEIEAAVMQKVIELIKTSDNLHTSDSMYKDLALELVRKSFPQL